METRQVSPIVIFDSGVGGLSIFDEVRRKLPWLPLVYCSDNAGFPYGPKTESEVEQRVSECLRQLVNVCQPQLIVIACNTASTVALPQVRRELSLPVVGVVPAIKTAANLSRNRCIGLLATPGTVQRPYTDQLIETFTNNCQVIRVGSSELVGIVEQKLRGQTVDLARLAAVLEPFQTASTKPDHIVLGCTHFPLLLTELSTVFPEVVWVDSGEAIARRVSSLVGKESTSEQGISIHQAFFTRECESIQALKPALASRGLTAVRMLF